MSGLRELDARPVTAFACFFEKEEAVAESAAAPHPKPFKKSLLFLFSIMPGNRSRQGTTTTARL